MVPADDRTPRCNADVVAEDFCTYMPPVPSPRGCPPTAKVHYTSRFAGLEGDAPAAGPATSRSTVTCAHDFSTYMPPVPSPRGSAPTRTVVAAPPLATGETPLAMQKELNAVAPACHVEADDCCHIANASMAITSPKHKRRVASVAGLGSEADGRCRSGQASMAAASPKHRRAVAWVVGLESVATAAPVNADGQDRIADAAKSAAASNRAGATAWVVSLQGLVARSVGASARSCSGGPSQADLARRRMQAALRSAKEERDVQEMREETRQLSRVDFQRHRRRNAKSSSRSPRSGAIDSAFPRLSSPSLASATTPSISPRRHASCDGGGAGGAATKKTGAGVAAFVAAIATSTGSRQGAPTSKIIESQTPRRAQPRATSPHAAGGAADRLPGEGAGEGAGSVGAARRGPARQDDSGMASPASPRGSSLGQAKAGAGALSGAVAQAAPEGRGRRRRAGSSSPEAPREPPRAEAMVPFGQDQRRHSWDCNGGAQVCREGSDSKAQMLSRYVDFFKTAPRTGDDEEEVATGCRCGGDLDEDPPTGGRRGPTGEHRGAHSPTAAEAPHRALQEKLRNETQRSPNFGGSPCWSFAAPAGTDDTYHGGSMAAARASAAWPQEDNETSPEPPAWRGGRSSLAAPGIFSLRPARLTS